MEVKAGRIRLWNHT